MFINCKVDEKFSHPTTEYNSKRNAINITFFYNHFNNISYNRLKFKMY